MVGKQPSALAVRRAEEAEIFFRSGSSYQVRAALLLHGQKASHGHWQSLQWRLHLAGPARLRPQVMPIPSVGNCAAGSGLRA
jgi:hypothetical protein